MNAPREFIGSDHESAKRNILRKLDDLKRMLHSKDSFDADRGKMKTEIEEVFKSIFGDSYNKPARPEPSIMPIYSKEQIEFIKAAFPFLELEDFVHFPKPLREFCDIDCPMGFQVGKVVEVTKVFLSGRSEYAVFHVYDPERDQILVSDDGIEASIELRTCGMRVIGRRDGEKGWRSAQ